MVKQKQPLPLSSLSRGIITEASPLAQPAGSSIDEENLTINNDGTRQRRLGMDIEKDGVLRDKSFFVSDLGTVAYNSFKWDLTISANGRIYTVVQIGNTLDFYEFTSESLTGSYVQTRQIEDADPLIPFGFASVDNLLVIGTSNGTYFIEDKGEGDTVDFQEEFFDLEIRDFFGVEDTVNGVDIGRGNEVKYRPLANTETNSLHAYNLMNQGWSNKLVWCGRDDDGQDKFKAHPIYYAQTILRSDQSGNNLGTITAKSVTPSNADIFALYSISDPDEKPRNVEVFNPVLMDRGLEYNSEAPKGNHIINLFNRGRSREEASDVYTQSNGLQSVWVGDNTVKLPSDRSPRSVRAVAEFAGRVFYAGFSGEVIDGDNRSPNLASYVVFSQLINYSKQLGQCYQAASPTNKDDPDLVATDGGFVRISGAVGINHLEAIGNSLLVFAENGVWQLLGGSDFGFAADNFQVVKITERGCVSPRSVINVGEQAMWCSDDGIYVTSTTDQGVAYAEELTKDTIKSLYDNISNKEEIFGGYDEFERTARWVYEGNKELVFKRNTGAWTKNQTKDNTYVMKAFVKTPPLARAEQDSNVVVGEDVVSVGIDTVTVTTTTRESATTEFKYLSVDPANQKYTFSLYNNTSFEDWGLADAEAFAIGSYFTGGNAAGYKQSPYITFHFVKTELGFDENFNPVNSSSCLVQPRWDFSNSGVANKFGREFQAYRFKRHFFPTDVNDPFDNGYETVITKNKIRGKGRALSLKLKSEPQKDLHLIGWEQEFTTNTK